MLCSDGLYAGLQDSEIAQYFAGEPQQTSEDLVAHVLSKKRPGQDNLTVAMLACKSDSFQAAAPALNKIS